MDLTSQRRLLNKLFVLLSIEGKEIMIRRTMSGGWKVYMHCVNREDAAKKCDALVRQNPNMIKL